MTTIKAKASGIFKCIIIITVAGLLVATPTWTKNITIKMGNVDLSFKMTLSEINFLSSAHFWTRIRPF